MKLTLAALLLVLGPMAAMGQSPARPADPFSRYLYPPDLVIANAADLALSDSQRTVLHDETMKAQTTFSELQWRLSDEQVKLTKLLATPRVDEGAVDAQVDKILQVEYGMKKMQLRMLVHIKNTLTPAQQAKLDALRGKDG
jgi:Spy/CpxP family protein refolding chaperone